MRPHRTLPCGRTVSVNHSMANSYFYEDLVPGSEFDLGTFSVDSEKIKAFAKLTGDSHALHTDTDYALAAGFEGQLVHGALMASFVIGQLVSMGVFNESVVAMKDLSWSFKKPIVANQSITVCMQITERHLRDKGQTGVVGRRFLISSQDGQHLQEGYSSAVVRSRDAEGAVKNEESAPSFVSGAWVSKLAQALGRDEDFIAATSSFDGSIAFHFGQVSMGLRIYRGRVIDSGRSVASDATFSIGASCAVWLDFSRPPTNEFIPFAMADKFEVRGSTYEYLRMTRAVMAVTDQVRVLLAGALKRRPDA